MSGLRQALYIARCLQDGLKEKEIVFQFYGDAQLVKMWTSFLVHNHWIYATLDDAGEPKWRVTDKGKQWLAIIEAKFSEDAG